MSRFLKILWSINGIILLGIFIFLGVVLVINLIGRIDKKDPEKVIVGKELKEAKEKGLILQGLKYSEPTPVSNSDGYLLTVSLKTYENPKKNDSWSFDADRRSKMKIDRDEYVLVNVIFLDKDYQPIRKLLNRKAFLSMSYQSDYEERSSDSKFPQKNITYNIAFEDTNGDGAIDEDDFSDLYISALDGDNLTQVTKGVEVLTYDIVESKKILIKYQKRTNEEEEYKKIFFSVYDIESKTLSELTSLHKMLDEIETEITQ